MFIIPVYDILKSMKYEVYDNFLPEDQFQELNKIITSKSFVWNWIDLGNFKDRTTYDDGSEASIYYSQFMHFFYANDKVLSPNFKDLAPVLNKLNIKKNIGIKANLSVVTPERVHLGYHLDFPNEPSTMKTAIYYLNTNNGATRFEDGTEISSVENRFVVFDSDNSHTAVSCTDQKARFLINFNYYEN